MTGADRRPRYRHIAVIDIGKTNAKVVVIDGASGAEIAVRKIANHVVDEPPYPHYDVDGLWVFVRQALREFAETPGFQAISITTHGASAALLDEHGALALPVLDYEYVYPSEIREAYQRLRPTFSETFSPALTGGLNLGAQLHYQQTRFPREFARVSSIVTYPQYWAFRLTGVRANEASSLGCQTDLWEPVAGRFSGLVDALGIRGLMAPIRSAFDALGFVSPDLAGELGLGGAVPVYCGIHDSNASLLPHLIGRQPPFAVVSTGTWAILFSVGAAFGSLDPARDTLVNVDAYGRPVASSRFMGGREFEMLTAELPPSGDQELADALDRVLARDVMLMPSVVQGSGPFPAVASRWISQPGDAHEIRAAASLYVALMTIVCLDLIGADGPVIVEGPFASNGIYLQALKTLLARPVFAAQGSTGTALGAAVLAGVEPHVHIRDVTETIPNLAPFAARWHGHL